VVDTLNDLDHVLFEILNEIPNEARALEWHYRMIDYVHSYEKTKPKQHPVGMTAEGGGQDNTLLFASNADWISPGRGKEGEYKHNPPTADGRKVIISDTDHLWGHGGNYRWVWRSFLRGLNPIFMDPWQPIPSGNTTRIGYPGNALLNTRDYPAWAPLRANMGYTRRFAERMNLAVMNPRSDLASSQYCLANPGFEYLVYLPEDQRVFVNLGAARGQLTVEWFNPRTGQTIQAEPVTGGVLHDFIAPFEPDAVLYIYAKQ
jgi:hypothetical protein